MIDVELLAKEAAAGVPASLRDDPTTWSDAPDLEEVRDAVSQATYDNVASVVAKAFGAASERIGTLMDAAITEDGPLADLDALWDAEITGTPIRPKLEAVHAATDWEGRVYALRDAMRQVAMRVADAARGTVADGDVLDVIWFDPRLEHLKNSDDFKPPAFLGLAPDDAPAGDIVWDDEPAGSAPAEVDLWDDEPSDALKTTDLKQTEIGRRGRGKRNGAGVPKLCGLLELAGFADKEIATILGVDKSYYSVMRSGKRPWAGLRDDVAAKLAGELDARRDALEQAAAALATDEVRRPAVS